VNVQLYAHEAGDTVVSNKDQEEVRSVLAGIGWRLQRNCAKKLRSEILEGLQSYGWSNQVRIRSSHGLTLTSVKNKIGLCLQTGNMARFYADLVKLQAQYVDGKLDAAVYIVPTRDAAKLMGSNIANFERLTSELGLYQSFITIPMVVLGFSQERN
jgi:hypothetical protein